MIFNSILEKNFLQELDNPSEEELLEIISNELTVQNKVFSLKNFIKEVKKLNYKALPHFALAKRYVSKQKKKSIDTETAQILKVVTQIELAEMLLNQGATIKEVKVQTAIPKELLILLYKQYYNKMNVNLLRYRLIQYNMLKLAKMQQVFFEESVIPLLKDKDKLFVEGLLDSYVDFFHTNPVELASLELKAQEDETPEE